jgi:hypothetical protein
MKTTVKTWSKDVVVMPNQTGTAIDLNVYLPRTEGGHYVAGLCLTPDQCGALIFGMEQALEVIDKRHRAALENIRTQGYADKYSAKDIGTRCHGDACAAGQLPCPTKAACGVEA